MTKLKMIQEYLAVAYGGDNLQKQRLGLKRLKKRPHIPTNGWFPG
jgi:hypothetical protein